MHVDPDSNPIKDKKKGKSRIPELWIIMEFMEGGTLSQAAKAYKFGEEHVAFVARETLKGLQYLHEKNWAHRDLKSHNIMMSIEGEIKLSMFLHAYSCWPSKLTLDYAQTSLPVLVLDF